MPFHTSRRGADLVQTWSEQFVPMFSPAVQDVLRKGFQQVNIRPPLPQIAVPFSPQTTGPSPFSPTEDRGFVAPIVTQPYAPPGYVNPPDFPLPPVNPGGGYDGPGGRPDNGDDGTGPGDWNPPVPNDPGDGRGGWGPGGPGGYPPPGPGPCPPGEYYDWDLLTCVPIPTPRPDDPVPDDEVPDPDPADVPPYTPPGDDGGTPCGNDFFCTGYFLDTSLYPGLLDGASACPATLTDGTCVCPFTEMFADAASTVVCPHCAVSDCGTLFLGVVCCYEGCGTLTNPLGSAFDNYSPSYTDCADWCTQVGDDLPPCNQVH